MTHRRVWTGIAVLVGVQAAAIGVYLLAREPAPAVPFAAENLTPRAAPALAFERADGSTGTLADLRGRVVIVHFWATWCEPCREELPALLAFASESRLELVAMSVDDDWETMRGFFRGPVPRVVVRPVEPNVHRRFGASALPDTYVVDARGQLVIRYAGARNWKSQRAREHVLQASARHGVR